MRRFARHRSGLWLPTEKPPFGSILISDHPLVHGMLGAWILNEGGGSQIFSMVDPWNYGTPAVGNPTWEACGIYTNNSGRFEIQNSGNQRFFTNQMSIAIRARANSFTSEYDGICGLGSYYEGWAFEWRDSEDSIAFQDRAYSAVAMKSVGRNVWFDAVGTFTLPNSVTRLYVNGVFASQINNSYHGNALSGLRIGCNVETWRGDVAYVMIWNRVLSDSEIVQINAEPYCMFELPKTRLILDMGAKTAHAYGEQNPAATQLSIGWSQFVDASGNPVRVQGDPDYGQLVMYPGDMANGPVVDTGNSDPKLISVERDVYGSGEGGNLVLNIKGSEFLFGQYGEGGFELYTGPVVKTWRYIQLSFVCE